MSLYMNCMGIECRFWVCFSNDFPLIYAWNSWEVPCDELLPHCTSPFLLWRQRPGVRRQSHPARDDPCWAARCRLWSEAAFPERWRLSQLVMDEGDTGRFYMYMSSQGIDAGWREVARLTAECLIKRNLLMKYWSFKIHPEIHLPRAKCIEFGKILYATNLECARPIDSVIRSFELRRRENASFRLLSGPIDPHDRPFWSENVGRRRKEFCQDGRRGGERLCNYFFSKNVQAKGLMGWKRTLLTSIRIFVWCL